jgi:hypothetical protein
VTSAISLLLCLALAVLWALSEFQAADVGCQREIGLIGGWFGYAYDSVLCYDGELQYMHSTTLREPHVHAIDPPFRLGFLYHGPGVKGPYSSVNISYYRYAVPSRFLGFGCGAVHDHNQLNDYTARGISTPLWSLMLVASVLPIRWLVGVRRKRARGRAGLCPDCGYSPATPAASAPSAARRFRKNPPKKSPRRA